MQGTSSNMEIVEPIFQLERFEASETLVLFSAHLPFPCLARHVQTQNLCPGLLTGCLLCVCIASPYNLRTLRQLEFVALLALTTLGWNVRGYQLITAPPDYANVSSGVGATGIFPGNVCHVIPSVLNSCHLTYPPRWATCVVSVRINLVIVALSPAYSVSLCYRKPP